MPEKYPTKIITNDYIIDLEPLNELIHAEIHCSGYPHCQKILYQELLHIVQLVSSDPKYKLFVDEKLLNFIRCRIKAYQAVIDGSVKL
jgi:hypothetical protein